MRKSPLHECAEDVDWSHALHRESVLQPLSTRGSLSNEVVKEAAQTIGISRAHFYRLLAAYKQRPQTSTLLGRPNGRVPGVQLLPSKVESLIHKCIEEFYMSQVRPSFAALMRRISHECRRHQLATPNYRTIRRRLSTYDKKDIVRSRSGAKAGNKTFRPVKTNYQAKLPFQLVQIDHSPVDLIVVDERDRMPIGRPWITLAIDVASRMVSGFYLSHDAPSIVSVALVLTQCTLRKDSWLSERGLGSIEWPVSGIPDGVHLDNAKEFHSHALVRGAQEYGIELSYRPLGRPHYGGHIERLIGTTMGAVHLLPGTTFSNTKEKGSYNSSKQATMTLAELEKWLALEVLGRYHRSIHSALGVPPLVAWAQGMKVRGSLRQVKNAKQFFCDFLPEERRLIRRDGIRMFNIFYWSNILTPLAGRSEKPVLVKYDPRDLSRIYLRDEESGDYWDIPYRDLRLPPISLWEQQAATKQLHAEGRSVLDEETLFEIVEEQRRLEEGARKSTRARRATVTRRQSSGVQATASGTGETLQSWAPADGRPIQPFEVEEWD